MRPRICTRAACTSAVITFIAAAAVLFAATAFAAGIPTVTVSPTTVAPGGTVTVTVANGPGDASDWVGLYAVGAADTTMLDWKYLNGSRVAPQIGVSSATLTFSMPSTPGSYNVRFFSRGAYTLLATSAPITVQNTGPATIAVTPTTVTAGATVTVTVSNGPGNARDWIGVYATSAPDTMMLDWKYLNGARTPPATGVTAATVTFTMPTTPGTYNVRFFSNDTLSLLATSAVVTVQTGGPTTVTATPASVATGGTETATIANGPGNPHDWVGLYPVGVGNASYVDWKYLNGLQTPPMNGLASATVTFTMAVAPGSYNVRLFANGSYTLVAASAPFTVVDGTAPVVSITAPLPNAVVSGIVTVSAAASDNVGVAGVQFQVDGVNLGAEDLAAPYVVSWDTRTGPSGTHSLRAVARDAAGNQATSAAVTVTVSNDLTPPIVSTVAASAITVSGATITWTTNEPSDSDVEYGLTAAYGATGTLNPSLVTAHSVTLAGLAGSTLYHYRVRSRDAAGNLGVSGDFTFTTLASDTTPPTVAITAPAAGASVSGTVTVVANASDNVGVVGVQFQLDGLPLGAESLAAPYSVVWDTTTSGAGAHTLTAIARDAAGNRTTSAAVAVTVAVATAGNVTLVWDPVTDPMLAGYNVYVGQASGAYSVKIDVNNVTTYTVTGLTPGQPYYFVVTAYDPSGVESGYSNEVSTTILASAAAPPATWAASEMVLTTSAPR